MIAAQDYSGGQLPLLGKRPRAGPPVAGAMVRLADAPALASAAAAAAAAPAVANGAVAPQVLPPWPALPLMRTHNVAPKVAQSEITLQPPF